VREEPAGTELWITASGEEFVLNLEAFGEYEEEMIKRAERLP
jgi:hypothetical protein